MRNATQAEYRRAIEGVTFPASKDALLHAAQDKGGLDTEVQWIFERLPDGDFATEADLERAVEEAYAVHGGLEGAGPAAPAGGQRPDPHVTDATEGV
jgi:hypothetical protein